MSVFNSLKPKASWNREAFDLSHRDIFSTKVSMLTPAFVLETIPDAVYDVEQLNLIRVDSMQTSPFARISQNTEYFFVPYSQIYRDFEKLYYERGDNQRNVGNVQGVGQSTIVPRFSLGLLYEELFVGYCLLQVYNDLITASTGSYLSFAQKRQWMEMFAEDSEFSKFFDVHGRLCVEDMIRNFDMLGYGNLLPMFRYFYNSIVSRSVTDDLATQYALIVSTVNNNPILPPSLVTDVSTYCSMCQTSLYYYDVNDQQTVNFATFVSRYQNTYVSVFRIAAFFKIWADFYRNAQYDVEKNYAYYFNYDYVVSDSLSVIDTDKIIFMLQPRYRQYKKDVFTGSYPSAQFGSVAVAATENPVTITNNNTEPIEANRAGISSQRVLGLYKGTTSTYIQGSNSWNIDASVSALSIRQALAFQRYKESILRAGNRMKSLQNAIFGDSSRYVQDEYVDFIGSVASPIDINTVSSTAETQTVHDGKTMTMNVGQLSANGISTLRNHSFKYNSHDFGLIVGVFYLLSESEYNAYGIDPMNRKLESFDFVKPHFQNLGLDPVFSSDNNIFDKPFEFVDTDIRYKPSVLGYLAKYYEYKTNFDKVHGEFYNNLPFDKDMSEILANDLQVGSTKGAFSGYVTARRPAQFSNIDIASLYARPDDVDDLFYASSDEHQSSDQFKVNMNHDVKAILPLSVIGLPQ